MWSTRLWFLVSLIAVGALAGGALTALPCLRDDALAQARAQGAAQAAARLDEALAAELADRRATAQIAARHPAVDELRALLAGDLPEHLRASVVAQQVKKISQTHARYGLVLLDGGAEPKVLGASRAGIEDGLAQSAPVKAAAPGKLGVGLLGDRWVVAAEVPGEPRWVLALSTPSPAGSLQRLHADAKLEQPLVVFAAGQAVGDAPAELATAAAALTAGQTGSVSLDGAAHTVARFPLGAAPGLDFALAWPAVQPLDGWAEVGGPAGLLMALFNGGLAGWLVLGVAALLGLLGVIWQTLHVRGATGRLRADLQIMAGGESLAPVDANTLPGWLRPVAEAANDAAQAARRMGLDVAQGAALADRHAAQTTGSTPPAAAPADEAAASEAEASAERSGTEASAEGRAAASAPPAPAEESAERSAPAVRSSDRSADRSSDRSAERSADRSSDRSTDRREPPSLDKTAAEQPLPTPPSSAPPNITASVDGSLDDSLDDSLDEPSVDRAVGTVEQPRPRPTRRTPAPRAVLEPPARGHDLEDAPTRQRLSPGLDSIDGSVFEMPAVRPLAVDDEPDPEPEALSDADIRLPQDTGRPRAANASGLLARLQAQAALEPEQRDQSLPPTPAPTDDPVEPTAEASTDDADDDLGDDEAAAPAGETTQVRPMPLGLFADRPGERTAVGPPPDGPGASAREATYRAVFEQFVATKRECGEADAVDFERFRAKLIRTRKTLMARFDCADVRFRVYVKAGKAALRAAPILDE